MCYIVVCAVLVCVVTWDGIQMIDDTFTLLADYLVSLV